MSRTHLDINCFTSLKRIKVNSFSFLIITYLIITFTSTHFSFMSLLYSKRIRNIISIHTTISSSLQSLQSMTTKLPQFTKRKKLIHPNTICTARTSFTNGVQYLHQYLRIIFCIRFSLRYISWHIFFQLFILRWTTWRAQKPPIVNFTLTTHKIWCIEE